ncbi:MAG: hypothetical protein MUF53_08940, partial [Gemmatimonadaceae bacterium]|nr:hypothetical protein [Gemmatimonadaceae bacterium]
MDGATVTAGGSIAVRAEAKSVLVNVVVGGGGAGTLAVGGAIAINFVRYQMTATVTGGATVTATGDVTVGASYDPLMVIVAGGAAGAGTAAVGIAVATNDMRSDIRAGIEGAGTSVTSLGGDVNVVAELITNPDPDSGLGSLSLGSSTSGYARYTSDPSGSAPSNVQFDAQIWSFALAGSGAGTVAGTATLSLNWLRSTLEAKIADGATVTAQDAVTVSSTDGAGIRSLAAGISGAGSAQLGLAISYNWFGGNPDAPADGSRNETVALIDGATVTAGQVNVDALASGTIWSGAISGGGSGSFAGNAGLALNWSRRDVRAEIRGGASVTTTGLARTSAAGNTEINTLAAQLSGSIAAVGAIAAYSEIGDTVVAGITGGAEVRVSSAQAGNVAVDASLGGSILTVGAGLSAGAAGIAGSAAVSKVDSAVRARVAGTGTLVDTDNAVRIAATSQTDIRAYGGTLTIGGASVGGTVIVNIVDVETTAEAADGATVNARGVGSGLSAARWDADETATLDTAATVRGLAVTAGSTQDLDVVFGTVAVGSGFSAAGTVLVTLNTGSTTARIAGAAVNSNASRGGEVVVRARHLHEAEPDVFAIAADFLGGGMSIAISAMTMNHRTEALIGNDTLGGTLSSLVFSGGTVEVTAIAREIVAAHTIGGGGGPLLGVSGAGGGFSSRSTTVASITAGVTAAGDITARADSRTTVRHIAAAVAIGAFGGGAGVSVLLFDRTTTAVLAGAINAGRDAVASAEGQEVARITAAGAAVGAGAGAGAVSVIDSRSDVSATLGGSITATRDAKALATGITRVNQPTGPGDSAAYITGQLSIGGVAAGAAVDVILLRQNVLAAIAEGASVTATRDVIVSADAQRTVTSLIVSGGLAAVGALAGGVSVIGLGAGNTDDGQTQVAPVQTAINGLFSGTASSVNGSGGSGQRTVSALNGQLVTYTLATGGAVGGTEALIAGGAVVTAGTPSAAGAIRVLASETNTVNATSTGAALSLIPFGSVALGAAATIVTLSGGATAHVESGTGGVSGARLTAHGATEVRATLTNTVTANAYGGAGTLGVLAVGAQVIVVTDSSASRAYLADAVTSASGVQVLRATTLTVAATATRVINATAVGAAAAGFGLAAGVAASDVTVSGTVDAFVGGRARLNEAGARTLLGGVIVQATASTTVDAEVTSVSAGIGAGNGNRNNVTLGGAVRAHVGDAATLRTSGDVVVGATYTPRATTDMLGVAAGLVAIGVSLSVVRV